MPPSEGILSENCDNEAGDSGGSGGFENEAEDKRPRCNKPRESLKTAENTQRRRDGLLDAPRKAKAPAKWREPGKKALQAAREMSQLLGAYIPPLINTITSYLRFILRR
jgi:hypothetical protein